MVLLTVAGGVSTAGPEQFVLGTETYSMAEPPQPAKGQVVRGPVFSTQVVRITDKARDRYKDKGIENEYARSDPENRAGTFLVLRGIEASWELYDARTFKRIRQLSALGRGGQEAEPRWDAKKPNLLYNLRNMRLMRLDVKSGRQSVVHDFKREYPSAAYISTGSEGDASLDRRYWCFTIKDAGDNVEEVVVYDRRADRIVGRKTRIESKINLASMDMSGRHCIVGYDNGDARVYRRDFSNERVLPEGAVGHSDLMRTADSRDGIVYQNAKTDWITMADLDTGEETRLLEIPFTTNPDIGLHISGNLNIKGWALVSTYGARDVPEDRTHSWMDRQLFMVELRPNPRIWRVAYTNAILSITPDGEKHYFAEAFAAINTGGTRVYWGANWGEKDLDRIETYSALLPSRWWDRLPAP